MVLLLWLLFSFVHSLSLPGSFVVAILVMLILILFLGGVALCMVNHSSRLITIHAGTISARWREIYFYSTQLPRIQG